MIITLNAASEPDNFNYDEAAAKYRGKYRRALSDISAITSTTVVSQNQMKPLQVLIYKVPEIIKKHLSSQ